MKLDTLDTKLIHKCKPEYLRLYNINEMDDWFLAIPQFIKRLFISTTNKDILKQVELQFGKIIESGDTFVLARRDRLLVEIEVTTKCNLTCANCLKASNFSSTWVDITMDKIDWFIEKYKHLDITVKITGGEAILHKHIDDIILKLNEHFLVILATNGVKEYTPPVEIAVENTAKDIGVDPEFYSTFKSPTETKYTELGCENVNVCGLTFNNDGFFPCPVAGVIHRTKGINLAEEDLFEAKHNMNYKFKKMCHMCGLYRHSGFDSIVDGGRHTNGQELSEDWVGVFDGKE